ncbi:MAG: EAL domain-containing protein [Pyrinomonadaceae bacterium]
MIDTGNQKTNILIVDDEPLVRNLLRDILSEDYNCTTVESAEKALSLLKQETFNLVISDINMGGMTGIELIPNVYKSSPDTVVMMISGNDKIDSAIEVIRVGAFDYIKKPFELEHVELAVRRALEHHSLLVSKRKHENQLEELVKQRTAQLNYLAYHDALTNLPNRILFEDRLSQALVSAQKNQGVAVLFISLDKFKEVRDTLGHSLGSQLLQDVASRLTEHSREGSTLARFESDEFAMLLTQVSTEDVVEITNDIFESFKKPFIIKEHEIFITTGIGISLFPVDGRDSQTLLKNAGAALSRADEMGGNSYQFYTADINVKALKRLALENNLRRALERDEFEVFYQPKIDINTRKIIGMEALVRWHHPELGLVSPLEFIPLAEETGLIVPIGEWILRAACAQSQFWRDEGFNLQVAVNLSARQFQEQNLAQTIIKIIEETKLNPCCLNLEVTESSIMTNAESAVKTLGELKELGIKISIDDFGTGYSSLGYLKRLPIDILKIDKSFVSDVTTNPDDAALVMAIVTLAHNLKLKVVAEGVETEEQLSFLHLLRCDEWQGYLYSKPVSAGEFEKLLTEKSMRHKSL